MIINEPETIKNEHQPTNEDKLLVVSIGTHTRLGDVLEFALANRAFESLDAVAFQCGSYQNRRILFAVSADASGENTELRALAANLQTGMLEGCVCVAIADGAAGGEVHLDLIRLLCAANDAGATVIAKPLVESGRELRQFAVGKEKPFVKYQLLARELVARLTVQETQTKANPLVRFLTALEGQRRVGVFSKRFRLSAIGAQCTALWVGTRCDRSAAVFGAGCPSVPIDPM